MGKAATALIIILCINVFLVFALPQYTIGQNDFLNKIASTNSDLRPISLNNDLNSSVPTSISSGSVLTTSSLFGFTDLIFLVWDFLKLLFSFTFAPVILLNNIGAPAIVVWLVGIPIMLIYLMGLISFIKGTDL